jgi:hypothetical protein
MCRKKEYTNFLLLFQTPVLGLNFHSLLLLDLSNNRLVWCSRSLSLTSCRRCWSGPGSPGGRSRTPPSKRWIAATFAVAWLTGAGTQALLIRIQWGPWIRIRIRVAIRSRTSKNAPKHRKKQGFGSGSRRAKMAHKRKASFGTWTYLWRPRDRYGKL